MKRTKWLSWVMMGQMLTIGMVANPQGCSPDALLDSGLVSVGTERYHSSEHDRDFWGDSEYSSVSGTRPVIYVGNTRLPGFGGHDDDHDDD